MPVWHRGGKARLRRAGFFSLPQFPACSGWPVAVACCYGPSALTCEGPLRRVTCPLYPSSYLPTAAMRTGTPLVVKGDPATLPKAPFVALNVNAKI